MLKELSVPRRALIVTGEASGDLHGANLIRAARQIDPQLAFFGVGGRSMAEAGCDILIPAEDLAVMGLVEVIGRFAVIRRAFKALVRQLQGAQKPDVVILIDYPGFNLRFAREAKRAGVPVLYYISPKVWAWRSGRVKTIAERVDQLAVIFPFEPELFRGLGLEVEYVGNPLLDEKGSGRTRVKFLQGYGLDPASPVVGLFPGSRHSELKYSFDAIVGAAQRLQEQVPGVRFLLPVASSLSATLFREKLAGLPLKVTLVEDQIYDTANACDAILAVSGTVTLQIALTGTPMAILYKMAPLTFALAKKLVKVEHVGLPNIVAGRGVVREFIQNEANPAALAAEIVKILSDEGYNRSIREGLTEVRRRMGEPGCSARVAQMASAMSRGRLAKETV